MKLNLKIDKYLLLFLTFFIILLCGFYLNNNVLILISGVFSLFTGFQVLKNKPQYHIFLLILFSTNCLYILPSKLFNIQIEKFEILVLLFSYFLWIIKELKGINEVSKFSQILFSTIIIIFFGALIPTININQSFIMGIFYQTRLLVIFSLYPLINLLRYEKNAKEKINLIIIKLSNIYNILLIIQYFTITRFQFLSLNINTSRHGNMRIYIYMFTVYSIFLCFSKIMDGKIKKYGFALILNLFTLIYIVQSRMVLFGVIISLILSFIYCSNFRKKKTYKKILFFILISSIGFIFTNKMIFSLIDLAYQEISNKSGNYLARFLEHDFYLRQVDNPLFGRGYYSPKTENAIMYVSAHGYFDLTDIGIVGLYVTNGIIGICWFLLITLTLLKFIKYLKNNSRNVYLPVCFLIFSISTCFTLIPYYYDSVYLLITFLLMELEKKEIDFSKNC